MQEPGTRVAREEAEGGVTAVDCRKKCKLLYSRPKLKRRGRTRDNITPGRVDQVDSVVIGLTNDVHGVTVEMERMSTRAGDGDFDERVGRKDGDLFRGHEIEGSFVVASNQHTAYDEVCRGEKGLHAAPLSICSKTGSVGEMYEIPLMSQ